VWVENGIEKALIDGRDGRHSGFKVFLDRSRILRYHEVVAHNSCDERLGWRHILLHLLGVAGHSSSSTDNEFQK